MILPGCCNCGGKIKERPVVVPNEGLIHDLLEILGGPLAAFNHGLNRGADEDLFTGFCGAFLLGLDRPFAGFDLLLLCLGLFEGSFEFGDAFVDGSHGICTLMVVMGYFTAGWQAGFCG